MYTVQIKTSEGGYNHRCSTLREVTNYTNKAMLHLRASDQKSWSIDYPMYGNRRIKVSNDGMIKRYTGELATGEV